MLRASQQLTLILLQVRNKLVDELANKAAERLTHPQMRGYTGREVREGDAM